MAKTLNSSGQNAQHMGGPSFHPDMPRVGDGRDKVGSKQIGKKSSLQILDDEQIPPL